MNSIVAEANKSVASAEYDSKEFELVISGGLYLKNRIIFKNNNNK